MLVNAGDREIAVPFVAAIVMTGGGARAPFWRQVVADIFNLPVRALATTDQAALGAAMLAAEGNSPAVIARLAVRERSERVVHYVATLGEQVEPGNLFWSEILARLPKFDPPGPDLLPHLTRFVAMTGYTRRGRETVMQWIRPQASFVA